jgi:hypothetical protein
VAETSPWRGRWAIRHVPPTPRSIVELIRAGTLDAELAATLWLLIEGRVPLVVGAAAQGAGKTTLLDALAVFLPPGVRIVELAGAMETFDWLPQAPELGWRRRPLPVRPDPSPPVRPDNTVLLIPSCPTISRRTPGEPRHASRSAPRRSATAWPPRSTPTRSTTSSNNSGARRSASATTSCRGSASS